MTALTLAPPIVQDHDPTRERDFHAKALAGVADDLDRFHACLIGLLAGLAITVIESDRDQRIEAGE